MRSVLGCAGGGMDSDGFLRLRGGADSLGARGSPRKRAISVAHHDAIDDMTVKFERMDEEDGGGLCVSLFNCYNVKDKCRESGFRWCPDTKAWTQPITDVAQRLNCDTDHVTEESIRQLVASQIGRPWNSLDMRVERGPNGPEMHVYNSYEIKDQLKQASFRFSPEKRSWYKSLSDVTTMLGIGTEISLENLLSSLGVLSHLDQDPSTAPNTVPVCRVDSGSPRVLLEVEEGFMLVKGCDEATVQHFLRLGFEVVGIGDQNIFVEGAGTNRDTGRESRCVGGVNGASLGAAEANPGAGDGGAGDVGYSFGGSDAERVAREWEADAWQNNVLGAAEGRTFLTLFSGDDLSSAGAAARGVQGGSMPGRFGSQTLSAPSHDSRQNGSLLQGEITVTNGTGRKLHEMRRLHSEVRKLFGHSLPITAEMLMRVVPGLKRCAFSSNDNGSGASGMLDGGRAGGRQGETEEGGEEGGVRELDGVRHTGVGSEGGSRESDRNDRYRSEPQSDWEPYLAHAPPRKDTHELASMCEIVIANPTITQSSPSELRNSLQSELLRSTLGTVLCLYNAHALHDRFVRNGLTYDEECSCFVITLERLPFDLYFLCVSGLRVPSCLIEEVEEERHMFFDNVHMDTKFLEVLNLSPTIELYKRLEAVGFQRCETGRWKISMDVLKRQVGGCVPENFRSIDLLDLVPLADLVERGNFVPLTDVYRNDLDYLPRVRTASYIESAHNGPHDCLRDSPLEAEDVTSLAVTERPQNGSNNSPNDAADGASPIALNSNVSNGCSSPEEDNVYVVNAWTAESFLRKRGFRREVPREGYGAHLVASVQCVRKILSASGVRRVVNIRRRLASFLREPIVVEESGNVTVYNCQADRNLMLSVNRHRRAVRTRFTLLDCLNAFGFEFLEGGYTRRGEDVRNMLAVGEGQGVNLTALVRLALDVLGSGNDAHERLMSNSEQEEHDVPVSVNSLGRSPTTAGTRSRAGTIERSTRAGPRSPGSTRSSRPELLRSIPSLELDLFRPKLSMAYQCPVCLCAAYPPIQCVVGHNVCERCYIQIDGPCPTCRGALRGTPNYAVLQALGETEVRCPMCLDQAVDEEEQADNKTVWIGRLDALMHHVESGHGTPSIG